MNNTELEVALADLFKNTSLLIESMRPRAMREVDEIEVVFMDNVNNRYKHKRAYTFKDVLEGFSNGGTPVGLILLHWNDSSKTKSKAFANLPDHAQEVLIHALAEAQDELHMDSAENGEEDE